MGRLLTHARGAPLLQRALEHVRKQNPDFAAIDYRCGHGSHKPRTFALETLAPLQQLQVDTRYLV